MKGDGTWVDYKGRKVQINTMSNRWLGNIKRKFKNSDNPPSGYYEVVNEIKRRHNKRRTNDD